jgi:hypothetical protein
MLAREPAWPAFFGALLSPLEAVVNPFLRGTFAAEARAGARS